MVVLERTTKIKKLKRDEELFILATVGRRIQQKCGSEKTMATVALASSAGACSGKSVLIILQHHIRSQSPRKVP